jgi:hypothetical protein
MRPTQEQGNIIDAFQSEASFKVNALAGTGKTSTLVLLAQSEPNKKGLYLAYNKALKEEAMKKFPVSVECKTIHGLAYDKLGKEYRAQLFQKNDPRKVSEVLGIGGIEISFRDYENTSTPNDILSPYKVYEFTKRTVNNFCYSGDDKIDQKHVPSLKKEIIGKFPWLLGIKGEEPFEYWKMKVFQNIQHNVAPQIYDKARLMWEKMSSLNDMDILAEHDTYLKLWQMKKPVLKDYDYILVDEAQDVNGCMLDITENQTCQIVYVGDQYQQIYSFRGSINAMQTIDKPTLYLTQSFRFGDRIAEEANKVLSLLCAERQVFGLSHLSSYVNEGNSERYTYIARTNASLLDEYITLADKGLSCRVIGTLKSAVKMIEDVYRLYCGKNHDIQSPDLRKIKDFDELTKLAAIFDEPELLVAISFVKKHGSDTKQLIENIIGHRNPSAQQADVILTTAHSSKGLEFDSVKLASDFPTKNREDQHLLYVAMTRAKQHLHHAVSFE